MSKIGIIVLHFGKKKITQNCIESILKSNYKNFEIIIIDNNSDEKFENEYVDYENIFIQVLDKNFGFAYGMNRGIDFFLHRKIDYLLLLNNDTKLKQNTLDSFLTAGNSNTESIFAPIIFKMNTNIPIEFGGELDFFKMYFTDLNNVPQKMMEVTYLTGACLFFSIQTFQIMGYIPEEYFMYSEDMDYSIIANKKNIPLYILPSAEIYHEKGATSGGLSPFTIYYIHRNRILLAKKYHFGFQYILFLVYYNILIFFKMMKWTFKDFCLVRWFWLGFVDGLKNKFGKSDRFL